MTVVFISKDDEEFKRYDSCSLESKRESVDNGVGFIYSTADRDYDVVVLNGDKIAEKKALAESSFASKDVEPFVNNFSSRLTEMCGEDFNATCGGVAFIHWGGGRGTVTDVEELAKESLGRDESWNKIFHAWEVYALSSRRPALLDVMRTPIQLPRSRSEVNALIDKAEGARLTDFWFRCVNELSVDHDSPAWGEARKYMGKIEMKILKSSWSTKDKAVHLDGVCEVIRFLENKNTSMSLKAKLFISRFLGEERRYV